MELALRAETGASLAVRIRVGHPAWCIVDGRRGTWDMEGMCSEEPDAGEIVSWCRDVLGGRGVEGRWTAPVHEAMRELAEAAVGRADRVALLLARKLAPGVRLFVYSALLEDEHGRIEQILELCPAIIAAAAARGRDDIVHAIKRGDRLRDIVTRAVESLGLHHRQASALLRAAPAGVAPQMLWIVSQVPEADINDLHATEHPAEWYAALATWGLLSGRFDTAQRRAFGGFVSRYGGELARHTGDACTAVHEIVDWLEATRAPVPSRRADLDRVIRDVDAWHGDVWQSLQHPPPDETPFPPPPASLEPTDGIDLEPIRTAGDLYAEGLLMRHCVASLATMAVSGQLVFFRGTCAGQRVTVCLTRTSTWHLHEAAGVANTPVRRPDLIRQWLKRLECGVTRPDTADT